MSSHEKDNDLPVTPVPPAAPDVPQDPNLPPVQDPRPGRPAPDIPHLPDVGDPIPAPGAPDDPSAQARVLSRPAFPPLTAQADMSPPVEDLPWLRVWLVGLWVSSIAGAGVIAGLSLGQVNVATFLWSGLAGVVLGVPAGLMNWVWLRPNRSRAVGWTWSIARKIRRAKLSEV
jgi:hypothetical protein